MSKAFDVNNHDILFTKLKYFGIRGIAWEWFRDRIQFTSYNSFIPLLFLIYINDLSSASSFFHFILFADDTNLIASHNDFDKLMSEVNKELKKVVEWFNANESIINNKNKCTLFS